MASAGRKAEDERYWQGGKQLNLESVALRRRVAELEALRDSEAQYRATLDAISDMLHVVDARLRIVLVNAALRRRNEELGLATDVVGKTIDEVYPFLPRSVCGEYGEVFKSGRLLITEERTQVGDTEIFTETRKIPVWVSGKVTQVITVMHDITGHRLAEETLRLLEASVQCATDAIVITRATSVRPPEIVYVNPAFTRMTGYAAEELLGKTVQVLEGPKTDLSAARRKVAAMSQRKVFHGEWILCRKDGSQFDMEMHAAPISNHSNAANSYLSSHYPQVQGSGPREYHSRILGGSMIRKNRPVSLTARPPSSLFPPIYDYVVMSHAGATPVAPVVM
jgi:PAS domain S-box-containing protein